MTAIFKELGSHMSYF